MGTLSYLGEPRLVRLAKFLGEIRSGELYVPRFQRPFVWSDQQRLDLLQSIYLGYPIGSVMVWRTQRFRLKTYERLGPVVLPDPEETGHAVRQYLLDGHQRITTLFASLGPGLYSRDELDELWQEDEEQRWPVYFDLLETDPSSNPFRFKRRRQKNIPKTWLGLDTMLDSYALRDFEDELRKQPDATRELVNRVQAVADAMRDYTIPVVPMATEDLEQVTTGFKRVNSGGSRMNEVHMVNALTWSTNFDLLERLDECARSLEPEGWGSFDQQMLLNVCKARFELDIYKTSAEELAERFKREPDALDEVRDSILDTARLLRRLVGVHGPLALPYTYQAVLLADALRHGPSPSAEVEAGLREWFWLTSLTEYFQSMTGSLFRRAQEHLRALVMGQTEDSVPPDVGDSFAPLGGFDYRSARSRALALLLVGLGPMLPSGEPFDAGGCLANHGNDALARPFARSELSLSDLAMGPENRFLLPPRSTGAMRELLLDSSNDAREAIAASHGISSAGLLAFDKTETPDYLLHARQIRLRQLERELAEELELEYLE